jgi:hypothetical protein
MNSHPTTHRTYERPDQWKHPATVILTGLHPRVLKSLTFASPNLPGNVQPTSNSIDSLHNRKPPGEKAYDFRPRRPARNGIVRLLEPVGTPSVPSPFQTFTPSHFFLLLHCSTARLPSRRNRELNQ